MGWWVAIFTWAWVIFYLIPLLPEGTPVIPPLEEKFVVTTYEEESCTNIETLTSRLVKTVEQVKID